jgi:flavodoxin
MRRTTPKFLADRGKILVIYFSRSGNTRALAHQIHQMVGGDIMEIQPAEPYPDNYHEVVEQARAELDSGYRPPLKTNVEDMASYDFVFVGSPNWWQTIAPPVQSLLSQVDLSGKIIAPFITHGGGGRGTGVVDIAALCRDSTIQDALVVRGGQSGEKACTAWLSQFK